jgi:hypothetical protein
MAQGAVEVLFERVIGRSIAQVDKQARIQLLNVNQSGALHPAFNGGGIGTALSPTRHPWHYQEYQTGYKLYPHHFIKSGLF